jgi:hypothetical protein
MKRREAIRNILLASASTIFITSCADKNVVEFLQDGNLKLNDRHEDYLFQISNTFLPLGDLKEKVGNPVDFILTMINDCHSPEDVQLFATGFEQYKMLMDESRLKISSAKEEEVMPVVQKVLETTKPPQEALIFFINKTKNLAVQHLRSSEYYMTSYLDYSLIPKEPFNGCAPT